MITSLFALCSCMALNQVPFCWVVHVEFVAPFVRMVLPFIPLQRKLFAFSRTLGITLIFGDRLVNKFQRHPT